MNKFPLAHLKYYHCYYYYQCVCVSWTWGSQRTILCSRFLPFIFTWVLGTELRVLGLGGKWFCLLHHLSGLVPLQLWALFFLDPCSSWTPLCRFKSTLFQANLLPSLLCHSSCQLPLCSRCPHIAIPSGVCSLPPWSS